MKKFTRGMTLIEVLIALAVLSIGLAGLASMQLTSLQYVHSAQYRSIASTVALDFEERLWLELADNSLTGCPAVDTGEGSAAAHLISDWGREAAGESWDWSTAKYVKIPNLTVTMGTAVTGTRTTEIPITLTWGEDRFSDRESTTEQLVYNVRILCRAGA